MQQDNQDNVILSKNHRHFGEIPLFTIIVLVSIAVWSGLGFFLVFSKYSSAVAVVGVFYLLIICLFFLFYHMIMIAHIKGNGILVNREQFPKLYTAVEKLSAKLGLKKIPEMYLIQSDGILNAMATKFACSKTIVIYSSLLEACGDNEAARDMIIGHELAHVRLGHLSWRWLTMPGRYVPFLGKAYSRFCEYGCDSLSFLAAGSKDDALLGLAVLAVGKDYASQISRQELVKQASYFNASFIKLGEWLSTHPPLIKRMLRLDQNLKNNIKSSFWGSVKAILVLLAVPALLFLLSNLRLMFSVVMPS